MGFIVCPWWHTRPLPFLMERRLPLPLLHHPRAAGAGCRGAAGLSRALLLIGAAQRIHNAPPNR